MIPCWSHGYYLMEGFRSPKLEFILVQHPWFENDCQFADIILPINTKLEEDDILSASDMNATQFQHVALEKQAIKPLGESLSDYEAVGEIAKKLGKYEEYSEGKTIWEKIEIGHQRSGVADLISWEDFQEKQFYIPKVKSDWKDEPAGMELFCKDPDNYPLGLPTGKMEFYSERLAEYFPDDKERPPSPQWVIGGPASEGWTHDERLSSDRAKDYPLLLITNHPRWREHVNCDDVPWLREILTCKVKGYDGYMYEPVWLHPTTAAQRGIESGDLVKVYNNRGIVLGGAYVTERIIPGAAYMDHGARIDPIVNDPKVPRNEWIDRGGSVNCICPHGTTSKHATGMATGGYLVQVGKLDSAEMEDWRKKYPEAFSRDYDPAYGLKFGAWVEGGMD